MAAVKPIRTLGEEIDLLNDTREIIRRLEKELKTYKEQYTAAQERVMKMLDDDNVDRASGAKATVSISEAVVGTLKDPEKFARYVKKHNAFELFEKRISSVAYREHLEQRNGKPIPGTEKFTRRTLNLRVRD